MNEEEIERKAIEELLLEAKRGRERADEHGTFGWNKPKVAAVNRRFLKNTLVSTMRSETDRGDAKRFVPKHKPMTHEWHGAKRRGSPERTEGGEKAMDDTSKSKKHKDGDTSVEKSKAVDKDRLRDYNTNGDNGSKDPDLKRESGSLATDVKEPSKHGDKTVSSATHSKEKSPVRAKSNASKGHSHSESSKGRDRMTRERN